MKFKITLNQSSGGLKSMKRFKKPIFIVVSILIGITIGVVITNTSLNPFHSNQVPNRYNIVDYGAKEGKTSFDNAKIFNEIIQKNG